MDSLIILAAFACGFAARQLGQPPMVGYLVAGFGLGMAGFDSSPGIELIADAGIAMMLFIIGLKLDSRASCSQPSTVPPLNTESRSAW